MPGKPPARANPVASALIALGRRTPLGRGDARKVLTALVERLQTGPFRTDYRGIPFELHLDNVTERKALFGSYNDEELAFLAANLQRPDAVFVDIGANSGFYTQIVAATTPARILAVEPNPVMLARIENNLALLSAGAGARVTIERAAIGADMDKADLSLARSFGNAHPDSNTSGISEQIVVVPLTDALERARIGRIDALKIDIAGAEDRALVPFFETAPQQLWPAVIVIEYTSASHWRTDILARMHALGYAEVERTRANVMLRRVV